VVEYQWKYQSNNDIVSTLTTMSSAIKLTRLHRRRECDLTKPVTKLRLSLDQNITKFSSNMWYPMSTGFYGIAAHDQPQICVGNKTTKTTTHHAHTKQNFYDFKESIVEGKPSYNW